MDRILFGDNQFFGVNHSSDEKSRAQTIRFQEDKAIMRVLDTVIDEGINTFMCTTHDRIGNICDIIRQDRKYQDFKIYPCMPYAHKYANAVTELGYLGTIKQFVPGNIFSTFAKGGLAFMKKDFSELARLMIDAEMKMFRGINTPVIWVQNVITDLLLGLGMTEFLVTFYNHIKEKYHAEPGFITMNLPLLLDTLEKAGIENPTVCASINKIGFRMSGGRAKYEEVIAQKRCNLVAMQVLAAGALRPEEAFDYVCSLEGVDSILFGASSRANIKQSKELIESHYALVEK
ncbi:hypothetical protein [Negadavirga shengliensis]|uniref:Uncharacterized protein n=1 Tax=Negadavirga shengliensis TaxID=1389218 RepID=A0ABV9T3V0_9BACT